jgi:hypothetical protein
MLRLEEQLRARVCQKKSREEEEKTCDQSNDGGGMTVSGGDS